MDSVKFWKNFNLGEELQIAGAFLYNSLFYLSSMRNFSKAYECFEVLYNASVGIERLQKIAIILMEHIEVLNQSEFEKELSTHNHDKLMNRLRQTTKIKLAPDHNNLLILLRDFYNINRYNRFKLSSISSNEDERFLLSNFIGTGLHVSIAYEGVFPDSITDQMRRYFGKALIKVSDILFNLIKERAGSLGIYTTEIESLSKAYKIFLQKETSFESELNFKREILIYLIANAASNSTINYLKQIQALDLSGSIADYIEFLLNSSKDPSITDELHSLYEEMNAKEIKARESSLEMIGENLSTIDDESDLDDEF